VTFVAVAAAETTVVVAAVAEKRLIVSYFDTLAIFL
jgi:hypothetical protein